MRPVQVRGEVISMKRHGAYHVLSVVAPGIPEQTKPGHFVALGVGGEETSMLLRRAFSIYSVKERGIYGGSVDIVFAAKGKGTAWLATRRAGDMLDVVGPLGRPFSLPRHPCTAVLVGGGYGAAPLFALADALRAKGCRVDFVMGAATQERLFGALDAKRISTSVAFATADGSFGEQGIVSDVLPALMDRVDADVVYACGPMGMLRAVSEIGTARGVPTQVAVEEAMACGIGVCMTCVLPVVGEGGITRMVRSCVEGPVFHGDKVRWADIGSVPADVYGAPTGAQR